jgi:restriction system protein
MLPLLRLAADGAEHSIQEARTRLAEQFGLTDEERGAFLPSGKQRVFDNRVAWAKTYLSQALLLEGTRRGHFRIASRGIDELAKHPERIDSRWLEQFPEFIQFRDAGREESVQSVRPEPPAGDETPEEMLERADQVLRNQLREAVLTQVRSMSPAFFETLVVDVLTKMNYGSPSANRALGRTGDGGIDGMIPQDPLGLDVIYLQAKRWENSVGRPQIQEFVGALAGKRAKKGVFITTSTFTRDAREYADSIEHKVILIDGIRLADLMIDHGVGVSVRRAIEIKSLDSDYFSEE